MKKISLILLAMLLFFTSCNVSSPITAVNNFLTLIKNKNYGEACQQMVNAQLKDLNADELKKCRDSFNSQYSRMESFSVQNAIPLNDNQLSQYQVKEGYEVFYTTVVPDNVQHLKIFLVKLNSKWRLISK